MATPVGPFMVSYNHPVKNRALRTVNAVTAGTRILQNQQPILSINTGVRYNTWTNVARTDVRWLERERLRNNIGHGALAAALNTLTAAERADFNSLHEDHTVPGTLACTAEYHRLVKNQFGSAGRNPANPNQQVTFLRVYRDTSLFNHSCRPNAVFAVDENGSADVIAITDIPANHDVEIDYISANWLDKFEKRQKTLSQNWKFNCTCPHCTPGNFKNRVEEMKKRVRELNASSRPHLANGHPINTLNQKHTIKLIALKVEYAELVEELCGRVEKWVETKELLAQLYEHRGDRIAASEAQMHAMDAHIRINRDRERTGQLVQATSDSEQGQLPLGSPNANNNGDQRRKYVRFAIESDSGELQRPSGFLHANSSSGGGFIRSNNVSPSSPAERGQRTPNNSSDDLANEAAVNNDLRRMRNRDSSALPSGNNMTNSALIAPSATFKDVQGGIANNIASCSHSAGFSDDGG